MYGKKTYLLAPSSTSRKRGEKEDTAHGTCEHFFLTDTKTISTLSLKKRKSLFFRIYGEGDGTVYSGTGEYATRSRLGSYIFSQRCQGACL